MKLLLLLIFLLSFSCSSYKTRTNHNENDQTTTEEIELNVDESEDIDSPVKPVDEDGDTLQVESFENFTQKDIDKFWNVVTLLDKTTKSKCFEDVFLNQKSLIQTNGKTKTQVVEDLRTKKPVVRFKLYYKRNSTVGYTYSNTNKIWMNKKFHNSMSDCKRAANIGHEISHKRGYAHSFKITSTRIYSVPYTVGTAIKECACD